MDRDVKEKLEADKRRVQELTGVYRSAISRLGNSENEFWVWYTLIAMDGEYSQQDICSRWLIPKQTVNTIVSQMVKKGLAFLEVKPGTRNRKIIRLMDKGRAYGEKIVRPVSDAETRAFNRLSESDRIAGMAALGRYISILKEEIEKTENR